MGINGQNNEDLLYLLMSVLADIYFMLCSDEQESKVIIAVGKASERCEINSCPEIGTRREIFCRAIKLTIHWEPHTVIALDLTRS